MKLSAIASALQVRLENGSPDTEIGGLNGIEQAGPGDLSFVSNPKYAAAARTTKASAVIVGEDFPAISAAMLRAKDPYMAFARALQLFHQPLDYPPGVHATAVVHASARIGVNAHIGAFVVIDEDVEIGANAVLLAHVVIYRRVKIGSNFFAHAHSVVRENCRVGNNVILQNGVVIGADGFGFAKTPEGRWHKIPQPAPVVIEDDVEVQANSCIDRIPCRRGRAVVRAGWIGRVDRDWEEGHSYRASWRGWTLQGGRQCHRDAAEWSCQ
jgi:UDP-3-O-[3-hydroxymyristoyl] glucosamine N-acyltransferase